MNLYRVQLPGSVALIEIHSTCQQGQIQEFLLGGTQTLFKKKNGSAWAPTESDAVA